MENFYQNSTISQILEAIINEVSFEGEVRSNIADILLSILHNTPYDKAPTSVIGALLILLKAKMAGQSFEPYDGSHNSRISDIILSILLETEYTEPPRSRIAELFLELKAKIEEGGDYEERTASGATITFITNTIQPIVSGKFYLNATQEGTGDPAPDNKRPIIGKTGITITQSGEDNSRSYTENWFNKITEKICYGGFYESKTGLLTLTHKIEILKNLNWRYATTSNIGYFYYIPSGYDLTDEILSTSYKYEGAAVSLTIALNKGNNKLSTWGSRFVLRDDRFTNANDFKAALTDEDQIRLKLNEPIIREVSPLEITTYNGLNIFSTDGNGDSEIVYLYKV